MTIQNIERDALGTAHRYANFAARQLLQLSGGGRPLQALMHCIQDCCESVLTAESARTHSVDEVLRMLHLQQEALIELSTILFAAEADEVLQDTCTTSHVDRTLGSLALGRQARRAIAIYRLLPTLDHRLNLRIARNLSHTYSDPFEPVRQFLLRKVAEHWAAAVEGKDARTSLAFLVELVASHQPVPIRNMVASTLKEADSEASLERIAQTIRTVASTLPSHNSSRATLLKNLALALARNATDDEIVRTASSFVQ